MAHKFHIGDTISAVLTVHAPYPDCLPYLKWELLSVCSLCEYPWIIAENGHGVRGIVNSTKFSLAEEYVHSDWYLREMTSSMTDRLLFDREHGTFVVRGNSRKPGEIVVSAKFGRVVHYNFSRNGNGIAYDGRVYKTVPEFIAACRTATVLEDKLRHWITKSELSLPEVPTCFLTMQALNLRIVAGCCAVATRNQSVDADNTWCLPLNVGQTCQIIKATRDSQWYVARMVSGQTSLEGLVAASLLECYIPDWFHGVMERQKAEQLLNKVGRDGTFLVRERLTIPGCFALSAWSPDGVVHIPLSYLNGKLATGTNPELPTFDSLLELVEHYLSEGLFWTINGECVRVIFPLSRKESEIPDEIQQMDLQSVETYLKALQEGKEHVRDIRLMVVGHFGAGKSTLTERLMGKPYKQVGSTNGIEIHVRQCKFGVKSGTWQYDLTTGQGEDEVHATRLSRLLEDDFNVLALDDTDSLKNTAQGSEPGQDVNGCMTESNEEDSDAITRNTENGISITKPKIQNHDPGDFPFGTPPPTSLFQRQNSYEIDTDAECCEIPRYKFSEGTLKAISEVFGRKRSSAGSRREKMGFISMWDFAGQFIFYSTHQIFLAAKAVYLLVLDLSINLDHFVEDEDFPIECADKQGQRVKDFGMFWLRSIHTYCGELPDEPAIILVGTKKDRTPCGPEQREEFIDNYFDRFRDIVGDSPLSRHIQPQQFAIDSTADTDAELERLKCYIVKVARDQDHWDQEIPAKWLPLERALHKQRATHKVVTMETVMQLDAENEVSLKTHDEVSLFLRYQHAVGNLIYIDDEGLSDCVVLDPQWIVDAFRCLITSTRFCKRHFQLRQYWKELQEKSVLREELVREIWKEEADRQFLEQKDTLLRFMEKLDIIAKPTVFLSVENRTVEVDFFFVPSLLRSSGVELLPPMFTEAAVSSSSLCFEFEGGYVPPAMFPRLLAGCMSRYAVMQVGERVILYADVGAFKLDHHHCFLLLFAEDIIKLRVFNLCELEVSATQCDKLRRFMTSLLYRELGRYNQCSRFCVSVHCGQPRTDTKHLLSCKDLLKHGRLPCLAHEAPHIVSADELLSFWFPDDVHKHADERENGGTWLRKTSVRARVRVVSERELSKVSQSLGRNWELVPIGLGVPGATIDQCKLDHPSQTAMQIYNSLVRWKQRVSQEATVQTLVQTIQDNPSVVVNWDELKNIVDGIQS